MMEIETKIQLRNETRKLTNINSQLRLLRFCLNDINKKNSKNISLNSEIENLDTSIEELSLVIEKIILISKFGRYSNASNR